MRVSDYIMQRLAACGVRHLFLVTGRGMLYLSDAAAKHPEIQAISVHHEQAASYAAMAYAQYNESVGACMVSTGCASTNAITGVLCAWQDEVPCIIISGQNSLRETTRYTKLPIRTYGQQEADIISLVKPITKYAHMLTDPQQVAYEMDKALHLMSEGRKGPVWLDIPLDVQNMRVEPEELERYPVPSKTTPQAQSEFLALHGKLQKAERPVVLIGHGVRSAGAVDLLASFVERFSLPVVHANSGVDIMDAKNPLALGTVGTMAANRAANFAVQNADLVLVLGNRLTSMTVGNAPEKFARNAHIAVIDIDEVEHKKGTVQIDTFIHADVYDALETLTALPPFTAPQAWQDTCKHWKALFPRCEERYKQSELVDLYHFAHVLSDCMNNDSVFICDAGLEELIMPTTMHFTQEQRCLHPASQGAMGYALPAAIGASLASQKQVVVVVGDGSIMMNLQELQTIAHLNLPIKIFVINNDCYAVIRKRQKDLFRTRIVGTDASNGISCPNFADVAACFKFSYQQIETSLSLRDDISKALAVEGALLCEVMAPTDQNYIHNSYAKTKHGKFVQRPLEDQSPYLDRDLFLHEMIIEPIDQ